MKTKHIEKAMKKLRKVIRKEATKNEAFFKRLRKQRDVWNKLETLDEMGMFDFPGLGNQIRREARDEN